MANLLQAGLLTPVGGMTQSEELRQRVCLPLLTVMVVSIAIVVFVMDTRRDEGADMAQGNSCGRARRRRFEKSSTTEPLSSLVLLVPRACLAHKSHIRTSRLK